MHTTRAHIKRPQERTKSTKTKESRLREICASVHTEQTTTQTDQAHEARTPQGHTENDRENELRARKREIVGRGKYVPLCTHSKQQQKPIRHMKHKHHKGTHKTTARTTHDRRDKGGSAWGNLCLRLWAQQATTETSAIMMHICLKKQHQSASQRSQSPKRAT